jgi:adenylosuccinate synthase
VEGKTTSSIPAQASGYQKIEGVYEKMPGWRKPTLGITVYDKLPSKARHYLSFIEKQTGARIGMVSTGPGREQTIVLDEFAEQLNQFKAASQRLARAL